MSAISGAAARTFRSLHIRNYRLYFFAQLVSVSGTWMQTIAQAWLVLHLTGSGVDLGIVTGLQFLPLLLFGPFGGLIADRVDKRTLLYCTQGSAAVLALVLGILDSTHLVQLWQIYVLASLLGVVNLFDNPGRQTFAMEMVGRADLPNAVSLNTVVMNASRVIGPALGGVVILLAGLDWCFFLNAASYLAVLVGLSLMRSSEMHRTLPVERARGQVRDGFRYVWRTPALRNSIIALAVVGIFGYNFQVTLALLAKTTFHGGAGTYSLLTSCMGAGAVLGGLLAAHRARPTPRLLQGLALLFGLLLAAVAFAPTLVVASLLIVVMGAASIGFVATANASLQLESDPAMRGRVMAFYAMAFLGTKPIGSPLVGAIAQWTNPRFALALGGAATVLAAVALAWRHGAGRPLTSDSAAVPDAVARAAEIASVQDVETNVAGATP